MAFAPTRPIYPTRLFDSFQSRSHGRHLQIFRYGFSNSIHKHCSSPHNAINVQSMKENPRKHRMSEAETANSQFFANGVCSDQKKQLKNGWIQKWNNPHLQKFQKRPETVFNYRDGELSSEEDNGGGTESFGSDWHGERSSTMEKIVEKLKKFGYVDETSERKQQMPERGSVEDIFYVEPGILPNSRGGFSVESALGVAGSVKDEEEVRFPWEKPLPEKDAKNSIKQRSRTSLAELTLPESELRRLRNLAVRTKEKTKIGNAGITQAVVDVIHEKWKKSEIVKLKCEGNPALNMMRTHEILERKTGGLVIWRSGSSISLYRGASYELPSTQPVRRKIENTLDIGLNSSIVSDKGNGVPQENGSDNSMKGVTPAKENKDFESTEIKYEQEVDELLEDLGPRFTDWPGCNPLPVDADLLPGVVPGYKPPFRILPYGFRYSLGNKETTALRRLARVLPPHFALGRSRQHQGLAVAMVKLWERSSIAKIALKRGVQITTSERMAEEIKKLTGGILLSRNKDYLVFYRGKDFLSPAVTEALLERERLAKALQDEEEQARLRASSSVISNVETNEEIGVAGTLGETLEADARWGKRLDDKDKDKMMRAADVARHAALVRKLERKLALAEAKVMRAEKALTKVEEFLKPAERPAGHESITDEERFMFRKLGLRMKAFLLLGRRGVFDGTVENMHLHWKYRELVKVIVKAKNFAQVRNIALSLEAESGGMLVSVDKVSKGYAIVVYRGREYQRPPMLRPKNLLTKRKALARSIELQRHEALCNHISTLQKRVAMLRSELDQMEVVREHGDKDLYAKLDSAYSTEDEDTEDEGDEAYLETYHSSDDNDEGGDGNLVNYTHAETDVADDCQSSAWESDSDASNMYDLSESGRLYPRRMEDEKEETSFYS